LGEPLNLRRPHNCELGKPRNLAISPGTLPDCNAAIALTPQDAAPLDSRALIYLKTNQWDAAIADYNAASSTRCICQ
jgi:hypothetical protein